MCIWRDVSATDFIVRHGYALLFVVSLLGQLGLPLPSAPLLLTAGALAATGKMNAGAAVLLSVLASMVGHAVWCEGGRRRGRAVTMRQVALVPMPATHVPGAR